MPISFGSLGGGGGAGQLKTKVFNSSGNFTVPDGVTGLEILAVGGGACGYLSGAYRAGGGGAVVESGLNVEPGQVVPIIVGAGGTVGSSTGSDGGNTTVGTVFAGGGSKNGASGVYSFDVTEPGLDIRLTDFSDTVQRSYFIAVHQIPNSKFFVGGHNSGYSNGDYYWNLWNPETMANPAYIFRGWSTGTNYGTYLGQVIDFKDKFVIFRQDSNPAVNDQAQLGSIQYVNKSAVVSGASVTATDATLPSGITMHAQDLRLAWGSPILQTEDYLYYATKNNGVIRTADGATWELVISYTGTSATPGNSGYGFLFEDELGRLIIMAPYTRYNAYWGRTNDTKTAWVDSANTSSQFDRDYIQNGGQHQNFLQARYDSESQVFRFVVYYSSSTTTSTPSYEMRAFSWPTGGSPTYLGVNYLTSIGLGTSIDSRTYSNVKWENDKTVMIQFGGDIQIFTYTAANSGTSELIRLRQQMPAGSYNWITGSGIDLNSGRFFATIMYSPYATISGKYIKGYSGFGGKASGTTYETASGGAGGAVTRGSGNYTFAGPGIKGLGAGADWFQVSTAPAGTKLPPGCGTWYQNPTLPAANGLVILRWMESA